MGRPSAARESDEQHLRRHARLPGGGEDRAGRHPAAAQPGPRDAGHPHQARRRGRRAAGLAGAAAGRGGDQGPDATAPGRLPGEVRGRGAGRGRTGALGPGRGRGQRDRRRPGAPGRRRRGGQGQVHGHPGDGHERGPGRGGHRRARDRPGRADRPAQRRPAQPHPGAGDPPQSGRDPGDLPARDAGRAGRPQRRAAGAGRGGADAPAAQVPVGEGRHLGRELRDRRDRDAGRRRVRGQRADVPDPARDTDQRGRRGEDPAHVPRSRGVPAAAAALVDRGADESLHHDVDRGRRGRRPERSAHRAGRQRADPGAGRSGGPPGVALHPLLGLPELLPGLRTDRWTRLRLGLPRPDRGDPQPAAQRGRGRSGGEVAALRLDAVRALLRGVSGADRHPGRAGAPAGQGGRRVPQAPGAERGDAGHAGGGLGVRPARAAGRRAAPGRVRPPTAGRPGRARADRPARAGREVEPGPRRAAAAAAVVPGLVGGRNGTGRNGRGSS